MTRRLAVALLVLLPLAARAQAPAGRVEISGQVQQPASFTIEALAALPSVEVQPDSGFEVKPVIIATKQDGLLLAAPRLVIPADHRAGRAVRDLVAIEVH